MVSFKGFTNLQPETKTIKFRLDPIGDTLENIKKNGILRIAEEKEQKRNELKVYIDKFHKAYIDKKMGDVPSLMDNVFTEDDMFELYDIYQKADKEKIEEIFTKLGKSLGKYLADSEEYKFMEKKEFIKNILPAYFKDDDEALQIIEYFKKSVTDITDLNKKRKDLYSDENKHGTIINRTIWVNLRKYLENAIKFGLFVTMYENGEILYDRAEDSIKKIEDKLDIRICPSGLDIDSYAYFCSQQGIDAYNTVIGGFSLEDGTKIPGLNEIINVHNSKSTDSNMKLPYLTPLYKQMMSEKTTFSFVDSQITSDDELYSAVDGAIDAVDDKIAEISTFINSLEINELDRIYVSKTIHGHISNALFGKYSVIEDALLQDYNENHPAKDTETKKYIDERKKVLNNIPCYSIEFLNNLIKDNVCKYFIGEISDLVNEYKVCKDNYNNLDRKKKPFKQSRNAKIVVKALLDSVISIRRTLKNLVPANMPSLQDNIFYNSLYEYMDSLSETVKVFNRARNYATKKEYEDKELSLSLVSGWTNPDVGCGALLFKDNNYYLALIDDMAKKCLNATTIKAGKDNYKIMNYNLIADAVKNCPGSFMRGRFQKDNPDIVARNQKALEAYNKHKTNAKYKYTKEEEESIIKYYQEGLLAEYDGIYDFSFKAPEEYESVNSFLNTVTQQAYKINMLDVDSSYIDKLVKEGKIYLFKVSSRDFSDRPKNTTTLFGLYWKILFDPRNIADPVHKLNGGARISFREHSIDNPYIHKAGVPIALKKSKDGKTKTFKYDIIKNKRYTYDSFFLSVSMNANFKAPDRVRFNTLANEYIRENQQDMHIIGITRGIKNLIYYTVIDMQGNVVEHNSLNIIKNHKKDGTVIEDDYNANLEKRTKENAGKKNEWDSEYTIKDLKQGYMSQVVSVISKLMIKYNAVVVLEDLSGNFKDKQKAIEKTVYTDFENALLTKLHFLITDKDISSNEEGSVLKPYQLCARVDNKDSLKFQNGFVFFLSPAYTTSLDPSTGFVNRLYMQYKGKENARITLQKFDYIKYEGECFKIAFDYNNFRYIDKKDTKDTKTDWIINTKGIRNNIYRNKATNNQWKSETVNLTEAFIQLFEEYNIDINGDIIGQVIEKDKSKLYDSLFSLIRLVLMTNNNLDNDYLYASPVDNSAYNEHYGVADNIASYNMARKGLMALEKIIASSEDFVKISSSTNEWLLYNQQNPHKA